MSTTKEETMDSKLLTHFRKWWPAYLALVILGWSISDPAKAEPYVSASIGRAEYPFHAWDQASMPNTEENQPLMYALSVGYRSEWFSTELGWYDFGKVNSIGYFAAEEPYGLDYTNTYFAEGEGYVKGIALSVLPRLSFRDTDVFLRLGLFHSRSRYVIRQSPYQGQPTVFFEDRFESNEAIYGWGLERNGIRLEYVQTDVQPHGDAAFGKVRALMVTFLF